DLTHLVALSGQDRESHWSVNRNVSFIYKLPNSLRRSSLRYRHTLIDSIICTLIILQYNHNVKTHPKHMKNINAGVNDVVNRD
ncbi:hypothetical protein, partial [Salmonella enterica]|uniref:hypothetical protein n=2 Tax=Salmonella enterica TaxID=28901 RepID=UPI001E42BEC0